MGDNSHKVALTLCQKEWLHIAKFMNTSPKSFCGFKRFPLGRLEKKYTYFIAKMCYLPPFVNCKYLKISLKRRGGESLGVQNCFKTLSP